YPTGKCRESLAGEKACRVPGPFLGFLVEGCWPLLLQERGVSCSPTPCSGRQAALAELARQADAVPAVVWSNHGNGILFASGRVGAGGPYRPDHQAFAGPRADPGPPPRCSDVVSVLLSNRHRGGNVHQESDIPKLARGTG